MKTTRFFFLPRLNRLSNRISSAIGNCPGAGDELLVDAHLRFPDNFEKLSPPILQLDEVEFYYSKDQRLFTGLNLSADLESRICIVRVAGGAGTNQRASLLSQVDLRLLAGKTYSDLCGVQVGENGAGKSTILKLLMGELTPVSGVRQAHR